MPTFVPGVLDSNRTLVSIANMASAVESDRWVEIVDLVILVSSLLLRVEGEDRSFFTDPYPYRRAGDNHVNGLSRV